MRATSLRSSIIRAGLRLLLLGCAALLFAGSIWWDNAANRGVTPRPAPPIPFTDVPRGGVNAYLLHAEVIFKPNGSVDPDNKVKRTFEMIAAAGMHWVRVQFPWEDIEICGKGNFRDCRHADADAWAKYDYIVEQAERNGLELIVRLDSPPDWARERFRATPEVQAAAADGRRVTGPPDNLDDFGGFAATVAARYRERLRFFQIWNEPNLPGEWNYHRQDPAELVEMLRLVRARIKAVNPDAAILFPALSPTDGRGDGVNDLAYLQGVYDAGGRELFDIMSAQLYGLGQPPTEHRYIKPGDSPLHPIDTKTDVGRVVLLREIMVRNGDERKAIWVSELGWNSAPKTLGPAALTWGEPVSEELKGTYLVQAMQRAEREWPWMGPMCIWMFRWGGEPPNPSDPTPFFQLVDFDFNPLPAYTIVKDHLTTAGQAQPDAARRNPVATAATAIGAGLVVAAGAWLLPALAALSADVERRSRTRRRAVGGQLAGGLHRLPLPSDRMMLALQALALLLFYFGSAQLPITALGGGIFLLLALLRPNLALLFIPATVPLYLAPKGVWDQRFGLSRPEGYFMPAHEFVLLCVVAGTALVLLRRRAWRALEPRKIFAAPLWPILLFGVVGTLGVIVAAARGAALREWRWLIVEPLLFYGLVRYWAVAPQQRWRLIWAWLITGAVVAAIGLLQLGGIDLAALLPQGQCFSERVVLAEGGLRRISSVYCHPNNLALALDRVWPVWAALALPGIALHGRWLRILDRRAWLLGGALLCLAALGATFSKGAFLGTFVALLLLGLLLWRRGHALGVLLLAVASLGAAGVLLLGLALGIERLNPLGGSSGARVELWTSALRMARDRPLTGVGLDQFYHYRTAPEFGARYIDPAARATNEQYASHPHNLLLDLLVRTGPLGLIAMAWLVIHFFRQGRWLIALPGDDGALMLGLIAAMGAALTHGLVDNFYFVPDLALSFWLMLGLADTLTAHRSAPPHRD
ncbi:MAG TPA: O-antigen ligase family protein [Herpetosiphonaceae bacterium]